MEYNVIEMWPKLHAGKMGEAGFCGQTVNFFSINSPPLVEDPERFYRSGVK